VPHPGSSWRPYGQPATQPHEYVRGGTSKILTLFHPATGQVYLQPVTSCTNAVLHGWLKKELTAILAALPASIEPVDAAETRAAWQVWQDGLTEPFTLPEQLPSLRLLLVWDNLTGHKSTEVVLWLCQHGIMPLYTPLGGSWLNMAESIQRILKRRALAGQHPQSPAEIGSWFEQTPSAAVPPATQAEPWAAPPRPGTASPHRLSGTASAASDGASNAVTPMLSVARQRVRRSRSQAARAATMNGTLQGK
jgi:transposase InsO family protein